MKFCFFLLKAFPKTSNFQNQDPNQKVNFRPKKEVWAMSTLKKTPVILWVCCRILKVVWGPPSPKLIPGALKRVIKKSTFKVLFFVRQNFRNLNFCFYLHFGDNFCPSSSQWVTSKKTGRKVGKQVNCNFQDQIFYGRTPV